jgi:hypothetical protein
MAVTFEAKPTRSSQGFLRHLSTSSALTLLVFTPLNGCSLVIGELPDAVDTPSDAGVGSLPGRDAGGGDAANDSAEDADNDDDNGNDDPVGGRPDASLEPGVPLSDAAVPQPDAMSDVPVLADAAPDGPDDVRDASPSAATDSGDVSTDAENMPCDRDEDGEPSETCGGEDCDDSDPNVHPGQANHFTEPSERVGFDYDCNGFIERDPAEPSLSCGLELAQCDVEAQGFMDDPLPACGEQGSWGQCVQGDLAGLPGMCAGEKLEDRRAACR